MKKKTKTPLVEHAPKLPEVWHLLSDPEAPQPPARNHSQCSVVVWLALSNGKTCRGECLFNRAGKPHDWFLEGGDDGTTHRSVAATAGCTVLAWAFVEQPPRFPLELRGEL